MHPGYYRSDCTMADMAPNLSYSTQDNINQMIYDESLNKIETRSMYKKQDGPQFKPNPLEEQIYDKLVEIEKLVFKVSDNDKRARMLRELQVMKFDIMNVNM